jgi:hypothetical protein
VTLHARTVTLKNYYKSFGSISGILAAAIGLGPLLSFLPGAASAYLFPPLGEATTLGRLGVIFLSVAMTYLAFYFPIARCRMIMMSLFCISTIALCLYLVSYMRFVRKIDIPSAGSTIQVSIGDERTLFATQTFASETDWEMLRDRGTGEEEIWRLWTARSIIRARLYLFGSVCGFILPLVLGFSLGVRNQMPKDQ